MSPRKLAAVYIRYFSADYRLADNAPPELRELVLSVPAMDAPMLFDALRTVSSNSNAYLPDLPGLLVWFSRHPEAIVQCDEALRGKQPPKNLSTVLRAGYLAVANSLQAKVRSFLAAEIEKFQ